METNDIKRYFANKDEYETMEALEDDIRNFLRFENVVADENEAASVLGCSVDDLSERTLDGADVSLRDADGDFYDKEGHRFPFYETRRVVLKEYTADPGSGDNCYSFYVRDVY